MTTTNQNPKNPVGPDWNCQQEALTYKLESAGGALGPHHRALDPTAKVISEITAVASLVERQEFQRLWVQSISGHFLKEEKQS